MADIFIFCSLITACFEQYLILPTNYFRFILHNIILVCKKATVARKTETEMWKGLEENMGERRE
jgi:hypothetical protein